MTRRRKLEDQQHSLVEIKDIMNSMKTLAYIETRKLIQVLDAQHAMVKSIETVAEDFLSFHHEVLPETKIDVEVFLLIGSERGFCGDFNQALIRHLESTSDDRTATHPMVIAVGHKLHTLLTNNPDVTTFAVGANVVEEGTSVLNRIVETLASLQTEHGPLNLYVIYHSGEEGVITQKLLPPFQRFFHTLPQFPHPPLLNLIPNDFLIELTDYYLFAALHEILYASLMAENHRRVQHLEGAVKHLDDMSTAILHRCRALRQEEITEEIEVILLSAASLEKYPRKQ